VSARHAADAEVRLYDRLFTAEDPESAAAKANADLTAMINPASLEVLTGSKVEPALASAAAGTRFQFERLGYFSVDPDSRPGAPVFNRTVSLKDSWAKASEAAPR
jgi:glutaminyl-tRNA synthetase